MAEIFGNTTATPLNPDTFSGGGTGNVISLTAEGKQISLFDVSPIEHKIECTVKSDTYLEKVGSKNILDTSDWNLNDKEFEDGATLTCEKNEDGTFTLNGHTGGKGGIGYLHCTTNLSLKAEQTYTLSFITGDTSQLNDVYFYLDANVVYYDEDIGDFVNESLDHFKLETTSYQDRITFKLPKEVADNMEGISIEYEIEIRDFPVENLIIYPQLELGAEVTEWVEFEDGSYVEKPYVEDLSNVNVRICGINLFDINKFTPSAAVRKDENGNLITDTYGGLGSSPVTLKSYCPELRVGDVVTLSANTTSSQKSIRLAKSQINWTFGTSRIITQNDLDSNVLWYSGRVNGVNVEATISNIQIEFGTKATAYTPYIEPQILNANADGTVTGIISRSPYMSIATNNEHINISCQYNVDTKKYIDNSIAKLKTELQAMILEG